MDGEPHDALLERVIEDGLHQRLGGSPRSNALASRQSEARLISSIAALESSPTRASTLPQLDVLAQAA